MDRRQALKKLAAGGAIAAGGSLVVSSNAVAQTTSGCFEAPLAPFTAVPDVASGSILVTPSTSMDPQGLGPTFAWQIAGYEGFRNSRSLQIRQQATGQIVVTGPNGGECGTDCPFPPDGPVSTGNDGSVVLGAARKNNNSQNNDSDPFEAGNAYDVEVWVSWPEANGCPAVDAYYRISGVWNTSGPNVDLVP